MAYIGAGITRFNTADDLTVTDDAEIQDDASVGGDLTVEGTATFNGSVVGIDTDKIEEGNSSVEVVDTGTGYVAVTVDGSETARFDANGRLGIGTTSPEETMQIREDNSSGLGAVLALVNQNASGQTGNSVGIGFSAYTFRAIDDASYRGATIVAETTGAGNAHDLIFSTNTASATPSEAMRLDSSRNLKFNSGYGSVATAYGCRAWVNFNGTGTVAIREDGNVSSITDNGTGNYTINFSTAMPDANYAAVVGAGQSSFVSDQSTNDLSTTSVRLVTGTYGQGITNNFVDALYASVAIIR